MTGVAQAQDGSFRQWFVYSFNWLIVVEMSPEVRVLEAARLKVQP